MSGFQYHGILSGAPLLGAYQTRPQWALLDLGRFPGAVPGHQALEGELYRVDAALLGRLDALEGCPEFYRRMLVDLQGGGDAFMYTLQPSAVPDGAVNIPSASWRTWCALRAGSPGREKGRMSDD
jgi:gamma-glutamylcyclotransferase (GGCT)/AIG2-like uncharacterized protein YtfP